MEDPIDIDEGQAEEPEALRDALVDQMAYLVAEIEALQTVVEGIPDEIKGGRPTADALSMKELYGVIATLDEEVRRPRVSRVVEEEAPELSPVDVEADVRDGTWNDLEMAAILDRVKASRRRLTDQLEGLPLEAWHRTAVVEDETLTLFELVHRMTQEDLQRLRDLGYRLHGAHLSDRDEPLPT